MTTQTWWCTTFAVLIVAPAVALQVGAYKILVIPLSGKSHVFSLAALAEGLADRGHRVAFFIGENFRLNVPELKNRSEIDVIRYKDGSDGEYLDYDAMEENMVRTAIESRGDMSQLALTIKKYSLQWCQYITGNDKKLDELQRERFDVAIVDGIFFAKCIYLLPHRLQIPCITYSDAVDPVAVRVPWLPSFVPAPIMPFTEQMTFRERLINTGSSFMLSFILPRSFDPASEELQKFQQYGSFKSLDELVSRSVLWLLTKDVVLDYPRPTMPNMVSVGGLTVKRTAGKLPSDIDNFIAGAENGVIIMTFGSLASSIPTSFVEKFSSVFGRLDGYRVIWRLINEDDVKLPKNVMVARWLPQNDILAHPAVKLFITHSGNNGQYEAVYHGVPMIGFPLFGDQLYNAKRLDHKGYGISMNLYDFTADQLFNNIHKILGDRSYKERVMKASEIFRNQPQSPVERATFWIEHVCRFGGDHLRSSGNDLPLYSYLMLDVVALILITVHILVYLLYRLVRFLLRKCCRRKTDNELKSKKTK